METRDQDVLAALRAATAARHAELDAHTPLAAPEVDLAAYGAHLRLLERWLAPVPGWLAAFNDGPQLPDYLGAIRADLAHSALASAAASDESVTPSQLQQLPPSLSQPPAPWPAQASAAYRWGVCYVVEGSQLGGAVLYKRLAARLAPHPLDYLRGNGSPGPRWQQFLAALRANVVEPAQIEDACAGARDAFDRLIALNRAMDQ
ncbi:UNVERIFIED_ORG: heme oxygenase [Zoogloea ramigera]|uniref:Biliverdin-producing heme oxygenase n=1 Tax=Duganella zoogloeoides TaxID=75659 RepID=A0ABZ0Y0C9_9BURK|nr:biliverdin-producing heme oxygenase [Duganella zoogloeoides]WQH05490.1 biliverdin-producing heme oxygenase [Duganella zoogloeoides]